MASFQPRIGRANPTDAVQLVHDRLALVSGNNERLGELLALSAGRVMLKAAHSDAGVKGLVSDIQLRHIADWLKAAISNDDLWLHRLDERGRPKKLMKFSNIDDIVREADKAMLRASNRQGDVSLVDGDEELFCELDGGYRIVRLLTVNALDRESAEMQHCVGNGGYDDRLLNPDALYLSLRDEKGKPHATLEILRDQIHQMQGKQNQLPVQRYLDKLVPFIRTNGFRICFQISRKGSIMDADGVIHDLNALPDGLVMGSSLDLTGSNVTSLPKNMRVGGSLELVGCPIMELPENLHVGGELFIQHTQITTLPTDLHVGYALGLGETSITALPDGLTIAGTLNLSGWDGTELPSGLTVGKDLWLGKSGIKYLPEDLIVGGNLYVSGLDITIPTGISDDLRIFVSDLGRSVSIRADEYRQRHQDTFGTPCAASMTTSIPM